MDMNAIEQQAVIQASKDGTTDAIKELNEVQLGFIGGGIEVSFH